MFGLGLDIYQELKQAPDVSDLLIAMFASGAMNTSRISLCFPNEVVSMDGSMGLRLPDGSNDTGLLLEVLGKLPSIEDMITAASGSEAGLIAYLNTLHPLLFPLLRWLFATSRGYLRRLEKEEVRACLCFFLRCCFFFGTCTKRTQNLCEQLQCVKGHPDMQQFVLHCGPTESMANFQSLKSKAEGKSWWAWHGSKWENFHSILRTGTCGCLLPMYPCCLLLF